MEVVLLSGQSFESDISMRDLQDMHRLVRAGHIEAVVRRKGSRECFNVRIIDMDATLRTDIHDTERPPAGEMSVMVG